MLELKRALGLWDVVLLNIAAVVSLRWLPVAAQTGESSMVLWVLAFLCFFVPSGLTVVELTTRYPDEGGIYIWVKRAFGDSHGFLCAWCYWINNLFYFPSLLISAAGIALYMGGTRLLGLSDDKLYVTGVTVALMWIAVLANVRGLSVGRWLHNVGAVGNWLPALLVTVLAAVALLAFGSATRFTAAGAVPAFLRAGAAWVERVGNLNFWSTMCFAFAGLELASTMSGEIRDPRRTIPRAILISGVVIALVYVLGTVALLLALPAADLSLIGGVPQAATRLGERLHLSGMGPMTALLLVVGSLGTLTAWFAGSARILFMAGLDRVLPEALGRLHPRHGTPYITLVVQGLLSTGILLMSALGKGTSVGSLYLVLVDMTLIIYFVPFLYLFLVLIRFRLREPPGGEPGDGVIRVPGGRPGALLCGLVGFSATLIAILLATMPPEEVSRQGPVRLLSLTLSAGALFRAKVIGGCLLFILLGAVLYWRSPHRREGRA